MNLSVTGAVSLFEVLDKKLMVKKCVFHAGYHLLVSMIRKRILTIWLSKELSRPSLINQCIPTHSLTGYLNDVITLDRANTIADELLVTGKPYLSECLTSEQYAKAADYLRALELHREGGIYVDADFEFLPLKNFDNFLENKMFCGREKNNFVSNAIIGAEQGNPILKKYLDAVDNNFKGSGDLVFAPGMYLFNEMVQYNPVSEVTIYAPEYFLPYNWQDNTMNVTEKTIGIHWYNRSWVVVN